MKVLCPSCERIAPAASFREEDGALYLRCSRCGAESALELSLKERPVGPQVVAPVAAPAPAPGVAAETGAAIGPGTMVPQAGAAAVSAPSRVLSLRPVTDAVRLAAEAAQQAQPFAAPPDRCPKCIGSRPPNAELCPHCGLAYVNFREEEVLPSPEVSEAFRRAMEAWDDPARHDAALAIATQRGELAQLGRLYRIRLVAAPTDPMAARGRDEVLRRAAAASEVLRVSNDRALPQRPPGWQYGVVAGLGLVIVVGVFLILRQLFAR